MKLLVVEDDLALCGVLAFTLRCAGYIISSAHDGRAALQSCEHQEPDLIILDSIRSQ